MQKAMCVISLVISYSVGQNGLQSHPLVRSAFCPKKIDHTSGLTLHPGYNSVQLILIGTIQKYTLHPKRPYIRGPYKRAPVYSVLKLCATVLPAARPAHRLPIGQSRKIQAQFLQPGTSLIVQLCTPSAAHSLRLLAFLLGGLINVRYYHTNEMWCKTLC